MGICLGENLKARVEELGGPVPEAITNAEDPKNFGYKEPEFSVGEDGRLCGGDLNAKEIFFEKFAAKQAEKDAVAVEETAAVDSAVVAPEPCC